jgi:hypothetical protein
MPDRTGGMPERQVIKTAAARDIRSLEVPAFPHLELSDWDELDAVLSDAPALLLGQAWLLSAQATFRQGIVRLGWQGTKIIVAANLEDESVFTEATADGQRLWELGDVFEIFLRDAESEDYLELHVAPDDKRLQLHFPSRQAVFALRSGQGRLEDFMVKESLFDFQTQRAVRAWKVVALIPGSSLGLKVASLKGRTMFASFGRYDYASDGGPAVLSSTSAHAKPDFHRQEEWTRLVFSQ